MDALGNEKKLPAEELNKELNRIVNNTIKKIEEITLFEHEKNVLTDDYGAIFFMNLFLYKWQANYILGKLKGFKATNVNEDDGIHRFYGKPRREFFTRYSLREGFDLFSETDNNIIFRQLVNFLYAKPLEYEKIVNPQFYEKTILSRGKLAKEVIDKLHKEKQQTEKINTRRNSARIFTTWALRFIEDFHSERKRGLQLHFLVYEKEYEGGKKTGISRIYEKHKKHDGITGEPAIEKIIYRGFAPGALHDYKYVITYKNVFSEITKDNRSCYISIGIHELKYWVFALLAGKGTDELLQKFVLDAQMATRKTTIETKTAKEKLENRLRFIQFTTEKLVVENGEYPEAKRWRFASKRKIKLVMLYLNRFLLQGNHLNRLDYKEMEEKIRWEFKFNKDFVLRILQAYNNTAANHFIKQANSIEDLFITCSKSILAKVAAELQALQSADLSQEVYQKMESLLPFNGKEFGEEPLNAGPDKRRYYHIIPPGFIKREVFNKKDEGYNLSAKIRKMEFTDLAYTPGKPIALEQYSTIQLMPYYFDNVPAGKKFTSIEAFLQTAAQKEDNKKKYKALQPLINIETLDRLLWMMALYYYRRHRKDRQTQFASDATLKEIQNSTVILSFTHKYINEHIPEVLLNGIHAKMPDVGDKAVINRTKKEALEIQFSGIQLQVPPYLLNTNRINYNRNNLCAAMLQCKTVNLQGIVDFKTIVTFIDEAMSRNSNTGFTATDARQLILYAEKEVLQCHQQEAQKIVAKDAHVGFGEVCAMIKKGKVPKVISELEVELLRYLRNCAMHYQLPVYYSFDDAEEILARLGITKRRLDAEGKQKKAAAEDRKQNRKGNNVKYPTQRQRNM